MTPTPSGEQRSPASAATKSPAVDGLRDMETWAEIQDDDAAIIHCGDRWKAVAAMIGCTLHGYNDGRSASFVTPDGNVVEVGPKFRQAIAALSQPATTPAPAAVDNARLAKGLTDHADFIDAAKKYYRHGLFASMFDGPSLRSDLENVDVSLFREAAAALSQPATTDAYKLPCDVRLPPATTIRAGCDLATLKTAMEVEHRPKHFEARPTPDPKQFVDDCIEQLQADYAALRARAQTTTSQEDEGCPHGSTGPCSVCGDMG